MLIGSWPIVIVADDEKEASAAAGPWQHVRVGHGETRSKASNLLENQAINCHDLPFKSQFGCLSGRTAA